MPTLNQLKRHSGTIEMRWFAHGKLWDSPEAAAAARKNPPQAEARDRGWRPGGEHRDPRERFTRKKQGRRDRPGRPPAVSAKSASRPDASGRDAAGPPRDGSRTPPPPGPFRPLPSDPRKKPPSKPFSDDRRPAYRGKPGGKGFAGKPLGGKPGGWKPKPFGGNPDASRQRPFSAKPDGWKPKPLGSKSDGWKPKPFGSKPSGDRPFTGKASGNRPPERRKPFGSAPFRDAGSGRGDFGRKTENEGGGAHRRPKKTWVASPRSDQNGKNSPKDLNAQGRRKGPGPKDGSDQ